MTISKQQFKTGGIIPSKQKWLSWVDQNGIHWVVEPGTNIKEKVMYPTSKIDNKKKPTLMSCLKQLINRCKRILNPCKHTYTRLDCDGFPLLDGATDGDMKEETE